MSLPVEIKNKIRHFVLHSDGDGLCYLLYNLSIVESIFQYINDPEFAELVAKNDALTLVFLEWILLPNQPPEMTENLSHFLYLCICHRSLNSAQRIIDALQSKNPETIVPLLAGMQISPLPGYPELSDISLKVAKLLHLYSELAYLGRWKPQGSKTWTYRDEDLEPEKNKTRIMQHTRWLDLILESIFVLEPKMRSHFTKEHPVQKIIDYYYTLAKNNGSYYSDDISDDSDSDDDNLLRETKHQSVDRKKQILRKKAITEEQNFYYQTSSGNTRTRSFWQQTKRTSAQNSGLEDKIVLNESVSVGEVEGYIKTLKQDIQQRPMIADKSPEGKKRFIAQIRGVNYMHDRWSNNARRFHYQLDEVGLPQLSESVLKKLPFDIYTELSESQDFVGHIHQLAQIADSVHQAYQQLTETGYVVEPTFSEQGSDFLFNHRADFLQHRYSNGISEHLSSLHEMGEQDPALKKVLINQYNYGISTGNRPYHAEKYAIGLKEYYPFNFKPYYNMDGRLIHSHAGKIYVILYDRESFLKQQTANRVIQTLNQGRTPIRQNIILELESTFIGNIPGEYVVHQEVFKFPSFHKTYKPIYEIKYGLNEKLYAQFQHLIQKTRPGSPERNKVLELLKEWLCAYYEVLLVRIAEQIAHEKNGILEYVDYANERQMRADSSPLTAGGAHLHDRNRLHVLQNLRWGLGAVLSKKKEITQQDVENEIQNILDDPKRLKEVYNPKSNREGVSLPTINTLNKQAKNARFYAVIYDSLVRNNMTEDQGKEQIARFIIGEGLKEGLFTSNALSNTTKPITSAWSMSSHLNDANYLYRDHEIYALLRHYLQPPNVNPIAAIFAAMHPMVTGPGAKQQQDLFRDNLSLALNTDQTVVIPINLTEEYIGIHNQPSHAGTHWVGLVVRIDNGVRRIFYVDPLNQEIPALLRQLLNEIKGTMILSNASILQQVADVNCGAWTVNNLNLLARAPANTIKTVEDAQTILRNQVTGQQLRIAHHHIYAQTFAEKSQLPESASVLKR